MNTSSNGHRHLVSSCVAIAIFTFPSGLFAQEQVADLEPATPGESLVLEEDAAIKNLLEKSIEANGLPGVVAAIRIHDQPIRIAAAGVRKIEDVTPITLNDQMHLGSCTKAITAALAGRLIEQKKLTMDSTIGEVLPDLAAEIHEDYSAVTLRQLLEHRGGIPETLMWWLQEGDTITETRKLIAIRTLQKEPANQPGSKFEYSNLGYVLAGLMCQSVTGKSWEELVCQEIFEPLEMSSAGFGPPGTRNKIDQPWGHNFVGRDNELRANQRDNAPTLGPAGTVHANLEDWSKFLLEMTEAAPRQLLDEETRKLLTTPSVADEKDPYACGWLVEQRRWADGQAIWHNGSNTFWYASTWISPSRGEIYMVVFNAMGPDVPQTADQLISELIAIRE